MTDESALAPLTQFLTYIYEGSDLKPSNEQREAIKNLHMILHPTSTLPTDLKRAVQTVNDTAKSDDHADGGLSAVFVGIASGKLLVKNALVHADKATKDLQFLESANTDFRGVFNLLPVVIDHTTIDLQSVPQELAKGVKAVENVLASNSKSDAVTSFVDQSKGTLFKVLPYVGKSIVKDHVLPWMTEVISILQSNDKSKAWKPVGPLDIESLNFVLSKKSLEKCCTNLSCGVKLYDLMKSMDSCFG